jgi:predicted secreted acid phosphatase
MLVDFLSKVFTLPCFLHRSETYNETSWDSWVYLAEAPALPASLSLYKELEQLGFKIFLLTGRDEYQRNVTEKNLLSAGYTNWERLILRYIKFKQCP